MGGGHEEEVTNGYPTKESMFGPIISHLLMSNNNMPPLMSLSVVAFLKTASLGTVLKPAYFYLV